MAFKAHIDIDQGSTFTSTVNVNDENGDPLNLSGYTANAQMRKHFSSNTYYSFTTSLSNGVITLTMSANSTSAIPYGRYQYDVLLTSNSGIVTRVVEGIATVNPSITR